MTKGLQCGSAGYADKLAYGLFCPFVIPLERGIFQAFLIIAFGQKLIQLVAASDQFL